MVRTIGWCLLAFLGLSVLAVISLPGADRDRLMEAIGRRSLAHSSAGLGYHDGALVWRETEPVRITVEQLPSLEGRRLGTSWSSGFFQARMSWFGVSLRAAIAQCLSLPVEHVLGDESLDAYWLDVDAARAISLFESGFGDWDPIRARILEGLCEHYGLAVSQDRAQMPLRILRAGPGFAAHVLEEGGSEQDRQREGRLVHEDGVLSVDHVRVSSLVFLFREALGVQRGEGLDTPALCSFEVSWDGDWNALSRGGDDDGLREILAAELDLHVEDVVREVPVARVEGVARPPPHLR